MEKPAIEHDLAEQLGANLSAFVGFARKRLNDPELAADVVQDSLLKALRSADQLNDTDRLLPWFYRILRRSIVDTYRQRGGDESALEKLQTELEHGTDEQQRITCECVNRVLPTLKPDYADILRRVDLDGVAVTDVARTSGLTANNATVRLHRARAQLRERLEQTCRLCAKHGCLDCTC
jgi:RNA polymerase sigma factor (sigma-70 family)